jgi:uncharacterized membrane protein YkvA (DUF1232 family)
VIHALIVVLIITAGLWLGAVLALVLLGKRTGAKELAMFLPNLLLLFRGLVRDPRCPRRSKALLVFAAAWIASPVDLIPEFIPFLGPLDDAVMAALVLRHLLKKAGPEVVRDHWRGDPATIERLLRASGLGRGLSAG